MQRRTGYILIAVSAWVLGLCWALSSPVGSSPDDDFHLTSIFCRTGDDNLCRDIDGAGPGNVVEVPKEVVLSVCFAFDPTTSGECWQPSDDTAKNDHWNYHGGYPPTFYAVMGVFASEDVARSVLIMRLVALTVALASFGLAAWACPPLRDSQLVAWSVFAIPLGMFLIPSTNPSSWGLVGVAAMWPAGYALINAPARRSMAMAVSATVLAAVLATSRGDTAGLAAGVLGLVILLYARSREQLVPVAVGATVIAALGLALLSSGQSDALTGGLSGAEKSSGVTLLWKNMLALPSVWAGNFGIGWGLGWLDTEMPAASWFPAILVAGGLSVLGLQRVGMRRGLVMTALVCVLAMYPLLILQLSGAVVGTQFQPRYVLPVLVALAGVTLSPLDGPQIRLSPPQRWVLTAAAALAASLAMHAQLRRYVTGTDVVSPNLNAAVEWSFGPWGNPNAVWLIATVAGAVLFVLVVGLFRNAPLAGGGPGGHSEAPLLTPTHGQGRSTTAA